MDAFGESSKLVIKQQKELMEAFAQAAANAIDMDALGALGETANKYNVYTDDGGQKFKVVESSEMCGFDGCCPTGRACCRPHHKLSLHVFAPEMSATDEVIHMDRPCKCGGCCSICSICQQEMTVYEGKGEENVIAHIKQPFLGGLLSPQLEIMDREDGETVATVTANAVCCIGGICCDHTFEVKDTDGNDLGKIVKERPDDAAQLAAELGTDADNFTLYMNQDLDVNKKAAMFSALYLVDYMFFENEGDVNIDFINGKCQFKVCDCYCCGCVCPCTCNCGGDGDGDGDGDDGGE